jgi:hypothetical protein
MALIAVLTTSVPLGILDYMGLKRAKSPDLGVLADVLGRNSTDCADLPDPKAAQDVLLALRAQPSVTAACIYNDDGKP